jgi:hypothetical protein
LVGRADFSVVGISGGGGTGKPPGPAGCRGDPNALATWLSRGSTGVISTPFWHLKTKRLGRCCHRRPRWHWCCQCTPAALVSAETGCCNARAREWRPGLRFFDTAASHTHASTRCLHQLFETMENMNSGNLISAAAGSPSSELSGSRESGATPPDMHWPASQPVGDTGGGSAGPHRAPTPPPFAERSPSAGRV